MPTILIKKSDTPSAVPTGSDLTNLAGGAEIAVNTADKRVFSMNSSSAIIELGTNPGSLTTADASATVFRSGSATITNLIATTATVSDLSATVSRIGSGTVTQLTSTSASITTLTGTSANITTLTGTSMNVTTATHASANITQLNSTSASITTLTATSASVTNLTATSLVLSNLSIASANVTTLTSSSATITNLRATSSTITDTSTAAKFVPTGNVTAGNGMYLPTTNTLAFSTDGSERVRVDSSGNVGIGITSPVAKTNVLTGVSLSLAEQTYTGDALLIGATGIVPGINTYGSGITWSRLGFNGRRRAAISSVQTTSDEDQVGLAFFTHPSTGLTVDIAESMRLDHNGNLGIGTATPAFALGSGVQVDRAGIATLRLQNSSGANSLEIAADSTTNGIRFYGLNNAPFVFSPNGAERMRITSAGELLVGGTTAINAASGFIGLERVNGGCGISLFRNDTSINTGNVFGSVDFYGNDTTANAVTLHAGMSAVASGDHAAGDNPTDILFNTTPDNTATVAEAGRITQAGSYVLKGGTTTAAAGVGIIFPATQVASANANSLDDYEEGVWTPTVEGSTTAGTYTTTSVTATYTKVGRLVTARFDMSFSAASGGSGYILIGGLPFNYKADAALTGSGFAVSLNTSASSSNGITVTNTTGSSASTVFLALTIDNAPLEAISIGGVSTSTRLVFSFSYEVS